MNSSTALPVDRGASASGEGRSAADGSLGSCKAGVGAGAEVGEVGLSALRWSVVLRGRDRIG